MNKVFVIIAIMLFSLVGAASAYNDYPGYSPHKGIQKVYGYLPQHGVYYSRLPYPVYHTSPSFVSSVHGYGHSYLSHRTFLGGPGYLPGYGFYAHRYGAIIHHFHRPLLYPGLYKFYW